MTSRERVLTALACQVPDRVPVNYDANPGIDARLKAHFGLAPDDGEGLRVALGVDFRGVGAPYVGPRLYADIPGRGVQVDDWGIHRRRIEHESGVYWDYCDFPLSTADEETIANWAFPDPDKHDYSGVAEACRRQAPHAVYVGGAGLGCIINTAGFLRGMEQVLVDLITDEPAGLLLIDRFLAMELEITRRTIEAAAGGFDFMWMGEDLGTQIAPLISRDIFRRHIRPRHQPFLDLARAHGLPVMLHTCGSSSWAYEDYIEMGVSAVDTLQPEAADMSPAYLKRTFGGRLAFHGCISTTGPVTFGTVDDVIRDCRQTLDVMMPGGGYCFAPTHCLQDNSPTENVLAMYDTVRRHGRY
ncbi:MAG: methylcobalamin:coenzyme M methyltransferase [Lentisphaerae bacterium ADurb.BinA184]|nr:MAG: methylcobalamin:coenzyme M methyltransferase [Lentisphaerae bacterium ADurb.BinA184]